MTVFINGKGAHRIGDQNRHCGGVGQLVEGSPNVIVGESNGGDGGSTGEGGSSGPSRNAGPSQRNESTSRSASGPAGEARSDSNHPPPSAPPGASDLKAPGSVTTTTPSEVHWAEIRIVDPRGEPISGLTLRLKKPEGTLVAARTDGDGVARWNGLAPGDHSIELADDTGTLEPSG